MKYNIPVRIRQLINLKKVPEDLQEVLRTEATKQINRLKRRLERWPIESFPDLYLNVHPTENLNQWESHLTLTLYSEIISVHGKCWDDPLVSLEKAFVQLFRHLDRYITDKRQHKSRQRKSIDKKGKSDSSERLDQATQVKDKDAFILLLKPYLDGLRKIVGREIRNLEIQGRIPIGALSVEDLINETLLRAWRDYHKRPKDINLDQWLVQISFQIIKQAAAKEKKFLSLSDALKPVQTDDPGHDPGFDSDQWWWSEVEPTDNILWEDLLPGEEAPESFRHMTLEEENKRLMEALSILSKEQRQIFSLFVLDGYDVSEIVKVMKLPIKTIKDTIENAKNKIRGILLKED